MQKIGHDIHFYSSIHVRVIVATISSIFWGSITINNNIEMAKERIILKYIALTEEFYRDNVIF